MTNRENEAGLIPALFSGVSESPLWGDFLDRLRHATAAHYAVLAFPSPGRALDEAIYLLSSREGTMQVEQVDRDFFFPMDRITLPTQPPLTEGQPYSLAELFKANGSPRDEFYLNMLHRNGITAVRQMRVQETSGIDAWLTVARDGPDFGARDTRLFAALAPVLRGVLQFHVAMERERFAASLNAETVRHLQFGWLLLSRDGHVLDCDEHGQTVLSSSGIVSRRPNGRLTARPAQLERAIFQALESVANNAHARPRAIILGRDPWLDMLLVPARGKSLPIHRQPAVVAYVHGDSWRSADRREQLAELFGLSPREARLALALSRGMTLDEAASEFGLTIGTTRSYSKAIYAKIGARGLPDLVRIVMRSILAIAPEG